MAFGGKLANLIVEFSVKGIKGVESGINLVSKSILGFAAAGLVGTTEGNALKNVMGQFSREVTSLFLPAIMKAHEWLSRITQFMQSLSGEAQDSIAKWAGAAIAVTAFGKALSLVGMTGPVGIILRVVAGVVALVGGTERAIEALSRLGASLGRLASALAPILTMFEKLAEIIVDMATTAIENLAQGIDGIAQALRQLGLMFGQETVKSKRDHRSVTRMGSGTEGLLDTYKRLQATASQNEINYPKQQVNLAEKQLEELKAINHKTKPVFGL